MKLINTIRTLALAAVAALVGTSAWAALSGTGTEADPFKIATLADLQEFRDSVNASAQNIYKGKYVRLDADLDLNNEPWTPIGNSSATPFSCIFDGNGKTISNLYINDPTMNCAGFIGHTETATITNLKVKNANLTGNDYVGAVAGRAYSVTTVQDCEVSGSIKLSGNHYVGGITGSGYAKVTGCKTLGDGAATSYIRAADAEVNAGDGDDVGGIIGLDEGGTSAIENCHVSDVTVEGFRQVGGIAGLIQGGRPVVSCTVKDVVVKCIADQNTVDKKAAKMAFGGIVGAINQSGGSVTGCTVEDVQLVSDPVGVSAARMGYVSGGYYPGTDGFLIPDSLSDKITCADNTVKNVVRATEGLQEPAGASLAIDGPLFVAQVGETKYENLMEAINVAYNGGTVELLADVTVERWHQNIWTLKDGPASYPEGLVRSPLEGCNGLTINGNGHTLTINGIDSGTNGDQLFVRSRNLTISDLTIKAASGVKGIGLVSGTISGVTFNMGGQPAVYTSGINDHAEGEHIEIRNCVFNSNGDVYGIYNASLPNDGAEALASGAIVSGNTFNTYRSVALRSDMQFLNNKVNGAKGVTVGGDATAVVVRGNIFADTNTSRSINAYPGTATYEYNVILGRIELEDDKTYAVAPDFSGNYWTGGDAPANMPEGAVCNSYYTTCTIYDTPAQDGSLFELSNLVSLLTDEVKVDVVPADVTTTVVDASGNPVTPTTEQQTAVDTKKTAAAQAIAANTPAAEKTGTGIKTVDESAYLKIALEEAVVEVSENDASLKTLVFDVQPMKVVGSVETKISNDEITAPITFRLPLTDDFTISALITHEGDDNRVVPVQGTSGQKYVELTFTHFSEVTATPTDKVESSIASTEQLGIIRYAPTDLYKHTLEEVAVGVPWLSTSSTSESDVAVTVAELIATGLTSGDQISVWDKANKRYDVWQWNGSAWVAALDADSGSTTTKSAYTTKVERGQAFWYKRNDATKTFALIGRPKDNATTTPEAGASKNPKYNLMSNPYPDAIDLAGLAGTEGDQIVTIPDGTFYTYTSAKSGWCTREWVEDTSVTLPWLPGNQHPVSEQLAKQGSLVIPSGRSFWYISKGGTPEINWKSLKKVTE